LQGIREGVPHVYVSVKDPAADPSVGAYAAHCKEDLAMSQATMIPTPPAAGQATALLVIDVQQ
jgi:hypothetical protein